MSLRRKLALTTALGMSLGVFATPAMAQTSLSGSQGSFGTVTTTTTENTTFLPTPTPTPVTLDGPIFTRTETNVAAGQAGRLDVDLQTRNAVIEWSTLNVLGGKTISFNNGVGTSTTAAKAVLNRVTGGTATEISGAVLTGSRNADASVSTGATNIAVWIVNGSGIMVGAGANINTGGLVLSALPLSDTAVEGFRTTASGSPYAVRFQDATGTSTAAISGGDIATTINTNNGLLALIAPQVNLTASTNSGTGATAYAIASDVSLSFGGGSPLSLTINAGTPVAADQNIAGAVVADKFYALITPQTAVNTLLNITAPIMNATTTPTGVVVLANATLTPVAGEDSLNGKKTSLGAASVLVASIDLRTGMTAPTTGRVVVYANSGTVGANVLGGNVSVGTLRTAGKASVLSEGDAGLTLLSGDVNVGGQLFVQGPATTLGNGAAVVSQTAGTVAELDALSGVLTIGSGVTLSAATSLYVHGTTGLSLTGSTLRTTAAAGDITFDTGTDGDDFRIGNFSTSAVSGTTGYGTTGTANQITRSGVTTFGDVTLTGANATTIDASGSASQLVLGAISSAQALTLKGGAAGVSLTSFDGGAAKTITSGGGIVAGSITGAGAVGLTAATTIGIGLLGDMTTRIGALTIDGGTGVTLGTVGMTSYLTSASIGQTTAPATFTNSGTIDHSDAFTARTTDAAALGDVVSGNALTVTSVNNGISFGALSGNGSKTLTAPNLISGGSIAGTGAATLTSTAGTTLTGAVGATGARVSQLRVNGGTNTFQAIHADTIVLGDTTAIGSVAVNGIVDGATLTTNSTGAQQFVGAITTSGAINATAGTSFTSGSIAGTSIGVTAATFAVGSVNADTTASLSGTAATGSSSLGGGITRGGDLTVTATHALAVTGPVTAAGGYTARGTALTLGTAATTVAQSATGTVTLDATAGSLSSTGALTVTSDSDETNDPFFVGGQGTTALALGGSTLKAGTSGARQIQFTTATGSDSFVVGNVAAGQLVGKLGGAAGTVGQIIRTGVVSFGDVVLSGANTSTIDASGSADALDLQAVTVTGGQLTLAGGSGGVSFTSFAGGGNKVVTNAVASTTGIVAGAITDTGSVMLSAEGTTPIGITSLGTGSTQRLGSLTIEGGSAVTIGGAGAPSYLTVATIGQTTAPATLTFTGPVDYTAGFTSRTAGSTDFGSTGLGTVSGEGPLSVTASAIRSGALSTFGGTGTIGLTADAVTIGAVSTTGSAADVIANRRTPSSTTAFSAASLSSAHDVLIGQTSPFNTVTLSAPSTVTHNFTADATGAVALNSVSVGLGGALDAATTGTMLTFVTLSGLGSKTLNSGGSISGTAINGLGAASLTEVTTATIGSVGMSGAGVTSLTLNGGDVTLGAAYVAGAVTGNGLSSLTANGLIDAGSLTVGSSGAQTYNATVTTGGQTTLTSSGGLVTTTGLVNAGTNTGAANRSLAITGRSVNAGPLQAGSSIAVTGNGTVAGNRDVVVGGAIAGTGVTIAATGSGDTTVSGGVTASAGNYAASGTNLFLTGGTQQATGAVTLGATVGVNAGTGVTIISDTDNSGSELLTVGGATTNQLILTGSTLQAGGNGTGQVRFVTSATSDRFDIGNVIAGTLSQQAGMGMPGNISRTADATFGNLTLSGVNTISTTTQLTTGAISVGAGALALTLNGTAGVTVAGAIGNIGATTGAVTINSSGGDVSLQTSTLAGVLTVNGTGAGGVSDVSFTTLGGTGAKVLNATGTITGTAITNTGAATLTVAGTGTITVGTLGTDATNRLGLLTINGGSGTSLGNGGTLFLTSAAIGQTTAPTALTVTGATDYTGTFISTTGGATMLGAVTGVGALSLTAGSLTSGALATSGATGTITLAANTANVGVVSTTGATADVVANRRGASAAGTSLTATSLSSARDVLIGQTAAIEAITLSAPSTVTRNFTATATGAVQLAAVAAGGALNAATTGTSLTFTALSGAGSKTLGSGGSISGATITGAGAVTINPAAAGAVTLTGDIGISGAPVASLSISRGGPVSLANVFATGDVSLGQTGALGSLLMVNTTLGGNFTSDTTGDTQFASIFTSTGTQAVDVEAGGSIILTNIEGAASKRLKAGGGIGGNALLDAGAITLMAGSTVDFVQLGATGRAATSLTIDTPGAVNIAYPGITSVVTGALTVGATAAPSSLTLRGPVTAGSFNLKATGNIATDVVTATTGNIAATSTGGGIIFKGLVDGPGTLVVQAATGTTFNAAVGGTTTFSSFTSTGASTGKVTLNGGSLKTTGAQSFGGLLTLGADTVLTGASADFIGGIQGNDGTRDHDLALNYTGADILNGGYLGIRNLATDTVTANQGGTTINGSISTSGSQIFNDAVTLNLADVTLASTGTAADGNSHAITFNRTVAGGRNLTVTTPGALTFVDTVGAGTPLTGLVTTGSATTAINGASVATNGAQSYGATTLGGAANKTFTAGVGQVQFTSLDGPRGATITTTGNILLTQVGLTSRLAALSTGGGGQTRLAGTVQTLGNQQYDGAVLLTANTTVDTSGGASVALFNGGVAGAGFDLTVNSPGAQSLDGSVTGVRNLTTDAAGTLNLSGAITTSGNQLFNDPVTLAGATSLTATQAMGQTPTITFANTLNGAQTLATTALSTSFAQDVGGTAALTSLTVTGVAVTTGTGTRIIKTTAGQSYNGGVLLGLNTQLIGTGTMLGGQINGSASRYNLTLTFSGANALIANPLTNVGDLVVDGAGMTTLNGGVTTEGSQTWTSAISVAAASTLKSNGNQTITLNKVGGSAALTIATGGATNLNDVITGITALTTDAGGTTTINTPTITTSSLMQSYGDNVVLGTNTTLTASGTATNSGISFAGTVTGPKSLTLSSAGQTTFGGTVGAVMAGAADPLLSPTALVSSGTGVVLVNGGAITTTGVQTYTGAVQLGADTVLRGTMGTFTGGIVGNNHDLRLIFANPVAIGGTSGGFDDLVVDNAASLTGTIVANTQTYNGAVTLTGDTVLRSGATGTGTGAIVFNSSVDAQTMGMQALTVTTGGMTSLKTVGGTRALSGVTINGTGPVTLNGTGVTTTGAQRYTGATTLTASNLLTTNGGDIGFTGTVNGPFQLSVQTIPGGTPIAGTVAFGGAVTVNGLAVRANAATAVAGNTVGTLAANVRTGGFVFADTSALTIGTVDGLAGVSTNGGAATITAAGLLTVADNVTATGATLTGTGLIQNPGTTVNGGSGAIVLDGNDGAITLDGLVTTTNTGGTAVLVRDAGNVRLANVTTGAGGTLTLGAAGADNLSGAVTQLTGTTLTVGAVVGNVGGSASLTNANAIGALGAFAATGLNLHTTTGLTVTGPVDARTADLTLTVDAMPLALQGNLATAGTATFTVGGAITQTAGSVVTANTLTGSATGAVTLTGANQIANLATFGVTAGGLQITDARSLTVTTDESVTGNLTLSAIGLDFAGKTLMASGDATLSAQTGALTGLSVTAANVTGSGDTVTIDAINAGTTPTGALSLTAANGLSLRVGNAGRTIALTTTNGALTSTGSLVAGSAGNTASTTQITTSAGGATSIASAVSNNGGVAITGGSVGVTTAIATNGALGITSTSGALSLGTGNAGTTATLSAAGTPAAAGTLGVTGSLTSGTAASLTATGAVNVASVESTGASVLVRGAAVTVPLARSKTTLTVQATGGDVSLTNGVTTGPGGDALVTATGNVTLATLGTTGSATSPIQGSATIMAGGTITGTSVVSTGAAALTAGGALQLTTLKGAGASATGLSVTIGQATATGALMLKATGGALTLDTGSASGTADLTATGDIGVATALGSGATATLTSSAGAVRVPMLTATGGDIVINAATGVNGGGTARASLSANGADGDVSVVTGGQALLGPVGSTLTASVQAGTIDLSTVTTGGLTLASTGDTVLGTGTVASAMVTVGGNLGLTTLTATGAVSGMVTGAATIDAVSGSDVGLTAGSAGVGSATAAGGALTLTTTGGDLSLVTGAAGTTATLKSAGALAVTTSLVAGNNGAANGNVTTMSTAATTIASVQSKTGSVAVTGASANVGTANANTTLLIRGTGGAVVLGTGDAGGAATLNAVGPSGTLDIATRLNAANAMLTAGGAATIRQLTTSGATSLQALAANVTQVDAGGTLGLTTTGGPLTLGTGTSGGAATLSATGSLAITTSLKSANSATTTATDKTTIGAIAANGGALSVTGLSATVGNASANTTLLIRGTGGAVVLGTGDAGGAATLDAVGGTGTLDITTRLNAASAMLTAGNAATVNQLTTTGATSLQALSATITKVDAGTTLGLTTTGGLLTLDTGTSGAAATLSATGPLAITTSLTSAGSATTAATGATTIAAITANGGAVGVTGLSANIGSATASTTLLIRGTGGAVTLGTGTAGGAAMLDAVGSGSALGVTNSLTAASATLTAGGMASVKQVTATTGALSVQAVSATITTADAKTSLGVATSGGALTLDKATAGTTATLNATGPLSVATSLTAGSSATTTSTGATTIGAITANGGAASVTGQSVAITTARGSTTLDATATGGNLTLGTGTASNGAATLKATGALTTTTGLTATGPVAITAGAAATLGSTTSSGGAVTVNAASIAAGQTAAATTLGFTSTGNLSLSGNSTTGTAATFDAGGTAALGQVIASGSASTITVRALDAAITGTQRASTVTFVNRAPATNTVKLGDNTSTGGFALAADEVNFVDAGQLTIDGGTGNVEIGALAFNANAGKTRVDLLATGRVDVMGTVTGAGAGRTFRIGGTAASSADKAAVIRVVATVDAGGRLLFDTADLDLRGARIGVGQAAGFLDPIGFGASGTPLPASTIASGYLANPNSALYNSTYGGAMYTGSTGLITAKSLTVRYTDYALFQNTGAPGISSGVTLASSTNPAMPALVIQGGGSNNAFAVFGVLNGIGDTGAAVSGSSVIQVSGADLANTRVNGCLAGSGAGCLTAVVSQPLLNIFDSSRLAVFRAADDLALPFDPVVGTNNEALFSGFGLIDSPVTDTECSADTTSPGCAQNREQGK